jgi:hypothetical protein
MHQSGVTVTVTVSAIEFGLIYATMYTHTR